MATEIESKRIAVRITTTPFLKATITQTDGFAHLIKGL